MDNSATAKMMTKREHNPFVLVMARDKNHVLRKISELEEMGMHFIIVCGEKIDHPNVIYREARGKWDAINYGYLHVPKDFDVIVLNDVDTKIINFEHALKHLDDNIDFVYCRVKVSEGPQVKFYKILNPIRKRIHITASGELMYIKKEVMERIMPIPPCLAEDSFLLFKALELKYRAHLCTKSYVTTKRTTNAKEEEAYKTRTTLGIYQALKYTNPPPMIQVFYKLLPVFSIMLAVMGEDGMAYVKGIRNAVKANRKNNNPTKF